MGAIFVDCSCFNLCGVDILFIEMLKNVVIDYIFNMGKAYKKISKCTNDEKSKLPLDTY